MSPNDFRRHASNIRTAIFAAGALTLCAALSLPALASQEQPKPSGGRQPAQAAQAAEQANLPSAEEVLNKFVEATGGLDAHKAQKNQHAVGKFAMPAMNIEGDFELFQENPDKFLVNIKLPAIGEIQTGLNGEVAWRVEPMQGPRLLEGEELKSVKLEADSHAALNFEEYYEEKKVVGIEEVNGEQAYHLVLKPKGLKHATDSWYSVESGLLLKSAGVQESPMGEVKSETFMSDYRPVGDGKLKQPHKITTSGGGAEFSITLEKVEMNTDFPEGTFDVPEEIRKLMEKDDAEKM